MYVLLHYITIEPIIFVGSILYLSLSNAYCLFLSKASFLDSSVNSFSLNLIDKVEN